MSVLYLVSPGSTASKEHGRVLVHKDGKTIASVPLGQVESVVVTVHAHISMPLIYSFLENGRQISFLDGFGHVVGTLGAEILSLERLEAQKAAFQSNQSYWVRYIVDEKMKAQAQLLKLYAKRKKILPWRIFPVVFRCIDAVCQDTKKRKSYGD